MTTHPPTAAVRQSFAEAQQQAAAMAAAGPPTPWNEAPGDVHESRRSPLWLGIAAVSIVAGGVAGWLGVDWLTGSHKQPPLPPAAVERIAPPVLPAPMPAVTIAPAAMTPASSLTVSRQSGVIRIASSNASLSDAVKALAQATHTSVKGGEALASIASPVTLNWQGNDTAAAWDALLGRYASIAVSCANAACEVWIVGVNAPRAAGGSPSGAAMPQSSAAPLPAPQPAAAAQSSEDTETN